MVRAGECTLLAVLLRLRLFACTCRSGREVCVEGWWGCALLAACGAGGRAGRLLCLGACGGCY